MALRETGSASPRAAGGTITPPRGRRTLWLFAGVSIAAGFAFLLAATADRVPQRFESIYVRATRRADGVAQIEMADVREASGRVASLPGRLTSFMISTAARGLLPEEGVPANDPQIHCLVHVPRIRVDWWNWGSGEKTRQVTFRSTGIWRDAAGLRWWELEHVPSLDW